MKEKKSERIDMIVYFAHPIPTYNTPREREALEAIRKKFPMATIINPAIYPSSDMWFYRKLVQQANIIVFMTTEEDYIGKGIFDEVRYAQYLQKSVYFYKFEDKVFYRSFEIVNINELNWQNYAQVDVLTRGI